MQGSFDLRPTRGSLWRRRWLRLVLTLAGVTLLLLLLGGIAKAADANAAPQTTHATSSTESLTIIAALLAIIPFTMLARLLLARGRRIFNRSMPNLHPDLLLPPRIFPNLLSEDTR
jgi:hypothetical protein